MKKETIIKISLPKVQVEQIEQRLYYFSYLKNKIDEEARTGAEYADGMGRAVTEVAALIAEDIQYGRLHSSDAPFKPFKPFTI